MDTSIKLTSLMAVAALASACATAPDIDPKQLPETPAVFREAPEAGHWALVAPAAGRARGEWWKAFGDPVLDDLVARADANNNGIRVAAARLAQARAIARTTDADRLPQVQASANVARVGGFFQGSVGPARDFASVGANLGYELDLFGKLSEASSAARFDERASAALLQSTRLLVQAEVAQ